MLSAFATMGSVYMEKVMGRANPSVGLVNNGAEETKGTPAYVEAHRLLKYNKNIRFAGNVEPKDVPRAMWTLLCATAFYGQVFESSPRAWPRCWWARSKTCSWRT